MDEIEIKELEEEFGETLDDLFIPIAEEACGCDTCDRMVKDAAKAYLSYKRNLRKGKTCALRIGNRIFLPTLTDSIVYWQDPK